MSGRESRVVLFWFLLALVTIQGMAGVLLVDRQERIVLDQAARHSERELDLMEHLIREPLLKHDYVTVVQFLNRWGAKHPEITHVQATASNGFVLADYGTVEPDEASVSATRRLFDNGQVLVTVRVVRNLRDIREDLSVLRRHLIVGGTLFTAGLGGTLWWILVRLGLRPLRAEIGRRIAAEDELRRHRNLLDEQVRERTRDLERTVLALRTSEGELTENTTALQRANTELQQLIYVIAHDLKGPLRAVSHLSTVLDEECRDALPENGAALLAVLRSRVKRMHALLEGLLAYSQAGGTTAEEVVDCSALVREIAGSLPLPAGVTVAVESLPVLVTSAALLRQVFTSLLENAVSHRDAAECHITVSALHLGTDEFQFAVSDDGPGIPIEYQNQVFELFQTLQARDSKEHAGIGLALVKKIVASHGGAVSIESDGVRGTTIRFTWHGIPAASNASGATVP